MFWFSLKFPISVALNILYSVSLLDIQAIKSIHEMDLLQIEIFFPVIY